jgi:anti-sigma28 factor (negative regulator of flagellin synthesis)
MTALLEVRTRIATRAGRRRFGRRDESRTTHMDQLRERIERDAYAVDPQKVADAIVRRLLSQPRRDADQCE